MLVGRSGHLSSHVGAFARSTLHATIFSRLLLSTTGPCTQRVPWASAFQGAQLVSALGISVRFGLACLCQFSFFRPYSTCFFPLAYIRTTPNLIS